MAGFQLSEFFTKWKYSFANGALSDTVHKTLPRCALLLIVWFHSVHVNENFAYISKKVQSIPCLCSWNSQMLNRIKNWL